MKEFVLNGKKYPIPSPSLNPKERQQRRLALRNERNLYHRKCDLTGKQIISMYNTDVPFPVYSPEIWFGNKWDARDYGQNFDFSRPFFEQFKELRDKVPHLSLISSNNENCDFCNFVGNSKDCYLLFGSINCRNCYYGNPYGCKDCCDSLVLRKSELCIECIDSTNLYDCYFCQNCTNSRNLRMCFSVQNSNDCCACVGLNRKQYCFLNKQYSKEEYQQIVNNIFKEGTNAIQRVLEQLEAIKLITPHRFYIGTNNENVSGNYIWNSKNCGDSYNIEKCEDIAFCSQLLECKDAQDVDYGEYGELIYEISGFYNNVYNCAFCYWCWDNITNCLYCGNCTQSVKNCFGCVGLKHAEYCILNKQYSKEEYFDLVPRIIRHMGDKPASAQREREAELKSGSASLSEAELKNKEWGGFFPINISPFAYNETVANEYFPITKEEAEKNGWRWIDNDKSRRYRGPKIQIPDNIAEASNEICKQILTCEVSGRPYKIIPQEFQLYKQLGIPLPRICPDERHLKRLSKRNPRELYDRVCGKTGISIRTTYSPKRPEIIYSEEAYLKEMY